MKYAGDFTSEEWGQTMQDLSTIKVDEIERRFDEFVEFTTTLNSSESDYDAISKKWNSLGLVLPIAVSPIEEYNPTFWRIRKGFGENENGTHFQSFSHPPISSPHMGRANRPYHPVFYCSTSKLVAIVESKLESGDTAYLSQWRIKDQPSKEKPLNLQIFWNYNETSRLHEFNLRNKQIMKQRFAEHGGKAIEQLEVIQRRFEETLLHDNYLLTSWFSHRLIYDCAHFIDGMMYPSNASKHNGGNLAFHPNYVHNNLELVEVYKLKIGHVETATDELNASIRFDITFESYADVTKNAIRWRHGENIPTVKLHELYRGLGKIEKEKE